MRASLPISLLAATVLTGCASVAIDENFAEVERFAREQTGSEVRWLRSDPEREAMRAEVARLRAGDPALPATGLEGVVVITDAAGATE